MPPFSGTGTGAMEVPMFGACACQVVVPWHPSSQPRSRACASISELQASRASEGVARQASALLAGPVCPSWRVPAGPSSRASPPLRPRDLARCQPAPSRRGLRHGVVRPTEIARMRLRLTVGRQRGGPRCLSSSVRLRCGARPARESPARLQGRPCVRWKARFGACRAPRGWEGDYSKVYCIRARRGFRVRRAWQTRPCPRMSTSVWAPRRPNVSPNVSPGSPGRAGPCVTGGDEGQGGGHDAHCGRLRPRMALIAAGLGRRRGGPRRCALESRGSRCCLRQCDGRSGHGHGEHERRTPRRSPRGGWCAVRALACVPGGPARVHGA